MTFSIPQGMYLVIAIALHLNKITLLHSIIMHILCLLAGMSNARTKLENKLPKLKPVSVAQY